MTARTAWDVPHLWAGRVNDGARRVRPGYGNTVSSLTGDGRHMPAIDVDVPARLIPSGTPGHTHLYLDVPMSWGQYSRLLHALADAGVVNAPHLVRAVDSGATFLSPWATPRPLRASAVRYAVAYAVLVARGCWRERRRRRWAR